VEAVLSPVAGVPWQHWAVLAGASWIFALVCFFGYYLPRSPAKPASAAYLQLVQHRRPDDLTFEHDRLYPRRRAA